jgi:hypothetical protein
MSRIMRRRLDSEVDVMRGVTGTRDGPGHGSSDRQAYTFHLDPTLVERARREIGEGDVIRSIEAALAAALDYQLWVRDVAAGARDILS